MRLQLVTLTVLLLTLGVTCDFPLPENWREAKDPLESPHYREILDGYFPSYIDFGDEDNEEELEGRGDGTLTISKHIAGGNYASLGQFEHHALLYMYRHGSTFLCGASLVRFNWVITAAHCPYGMTSFELYFGIIDRRGSAQWKETINDHEYVKIHPHYNDDTLEHDIAMMFMASATEELLTYDHVALVRLPTFDNQDVSLTNRLGTVCGFGRTNDVSSDSSAVLKYITRPIISTESCERVFNIFPTNLCIDTSGGQSTCSGDSGGGLTAEIEEDGGSVLVGIVSFGAALGCTRGYPTGFTAVLSYLDWIEAVLDGVDDDFSTAATESSSDKKTTDDSVGFAGAIKMKDLFSIIILSQIFVTFLVK